MNALLWISFCLGIAYCAPPGLVTAETLRRGLARGFWPAFLVQLGSLVGDSAWALLAVSGLAFAVQNVIIRMLLSLLGVTFIAWLAWNAWQDARTGSLPQTRASLMTQNDFTTGAMLSLSNPYAIAFWMGVGGTVYTAAHITSPQWYHAAGFLSAFVLGACAWCFFMAGLITWGRRVLGVSFFRWLNLACATFLGIIGIQLLWQVFLEVPALLAHL